MWITAVLLMAPVVYVLSFGPADYAMKCCNARGVKIVLTVYAPVVWLHDHTLLREPLEWYAAFWTPGWKP